MNIFSFLQNNINIPFSGYLNSFTDYPFIGKVVYIFSDAPIFIIPIFFIGYWLFFAYKKDAERKKQLLYILYAIILAISLSILIQQFVHIDRPEESLKASGKLILQHIPDASFPSDHASVSSAFLVSALLFGFQNIAWYILPFFVIMLLSRIAGGIHWPLDILVGILLGFLSSGIVYKIQNFHIVKKINTFILTLASYFKL